MVGRRRERSTKKKQQEKKKHEKTNWTITKERRLGPAETETEHGRPLRVSEGSKGYARAPMNTRNSERTERTHDETENQGDGGIW